jgi:hypothetical protein
MKRIGFILIFFFSFSILSQEKIGKPFFTGSFNVSLAINENYVLFDADDGETLLIPSAAFFRVGFGYEFMKRVAISVNGGFDYHWNYAISAFPTYGTLRFNITEDEGDAFFVETSYGKMWRPSNNYPNGNYYGVGLGWQIAGEKRWNTIFRIDFHRKGIVGFENNRLDSVSLGIGFSFF